MISDQIRQLQNASQFLIKLNCEDHLFKKDAIWGYTILESMDEIFPVPVRPGRAGFRHFKLQFTLDTQLSGYLTPYIFCISSLLKR